ncbi:NUDIX hydrolase [Pseudoruegeria sp. SHC-113]|uniref:NUDIX hydrolase n=1 Tax=Pseudoruegeria sp. SHC-113 TaxID=2855439 RepID=UPI0021BABC60|nr:NUDIX hydrolase [Pseudoruegeria sp. SHC-113]MCT8160943.1 NUDIX hydrolase [Pseudoruegeria sp. SHC-113]
MAKRPELAVLAILLTESHALLVQRRNPPDAGLWGFPGGRVEYGETVLQAAERELQEETGLTARGVHVLGHADAISPGFHFYLAGVICKGAPSTPVAADDALDARWVPLADIAEGALPLSPGVADTCVAAKAWLAANLPEGPS